MQGPSKIAEELERDLGEQLRNERVRQRLEQVQVAARAGVTRKTVSRLENGAGATVHSLMAVLRALGRADWIATLAPAIAVSPMELLRSQRPPKTRVRVRKDERE